MGRTFLLAGALFAFLSVALGAFGAHALKDRIDARSLEIFQTGAHYQGYHALALLILGIALVARPDLGKLRTAGWLFVTGIVIFSGSLYALSTTGVKWLGAITPIGGVCFLSGWIIVLVVAASLRADPQS